MIFKLDFRFLKEKKKEAVSLLTDVGMAFLARVQKTLYTSHNTNPHKLCLTKLRHI